MPRSTGCARLAWIFAATWWPDRAGGKSCSPTPPPRRHPHRTVPSRLGGFVTVPHPLAGRVALVAGATRGAGRAIAVELSRAGAYVYATGRSSRTAGPSEIDRPE